MTSKEEKFKEKLPIITGRSALPVLQMKHPEAFGAVVRAVALGARLRTRPAVLDRPAPGCSSIGESALWTALDARARVQRAVRAGGALRARRTAALQASPVAGVALIIHGIIA